MDVFHAIRGNPDLFSCVRELCSENGACLKFAKELLSADDGPDHERVLILKPDEYYSSRNMRDPEAAVDCLVLVKCCDGNAYDLYLVELRDSRRADLLRPSEIRAKFETVLHDFIGNRFADIFFAEGVEYRQIGLLFLVAPLALIAARGPEAVRSFVRGTVLERFLSERPIRFADRQLLMQPIDPTNEVPPC